MVYREYPWLNKTFVVIHTTGFGLMESPLEEHGVVWASNTLEEAHTKGKELYPPNPADKGWDYNGYIVAVNTSTNNGKMLLENLHKQ